MKIRKTIMPQSFLNVCDQETFKNVKPKPKAEEQGHSHKVMGTRARDPQPMRGKNQGQLPTAHKGKYKQGQGGHSLGEVESVGSNEA